MKYLLRVFNFPETLWRKLSLLAFSAFFINIGIDHFVNPEFYLTIMPPMMPLHLEAVYISGFFEILGGLGLLISRFRKISGWGLLALLIAVYPANIYMAITPEAFPDIPIYALYLRLALQFLFRVLKLILRVVANVSMLLLRLLPRELA